MTNTTATFANAADVLDYLGEFCLAPWARHAAGKIQTGNATVDRALALIAADEEAVLVGDLSDKDNRAKAETVVAAFNLVWATRDAQ